MKRLVILFFSMASLSAWAAGALEPKVCYKRCMDELDDKKKCEYICYEKK